MKNFVRKRDRIRHGYIFISNRELEEQGMSEFIGKWGFFNYNGVEHSVWGFGIDGILIKSIKGGRKNDAE